ncbi:DMT family transporter [Macrococcus lamae]|uniref:EamA family transporter n=1 Tax=Macrococcus lamae TaxID=198484 RepID=A0A4R6BU38_9STAP|nr:DMT family transporter [Macrococcus lamae]TDM07928.1 EamA family transporter [Macrococcus lamae]
MSNQLKGIVLIICGTVFWGIGGTVAEVLFKDYGLDVNDYVKFRLIVSGLLLLLLALIRKQPVTAPFKNKWTALQMLVYSVFGMLAVQYTYMASIQTGNAAVATLLQYLSPVVILIFYVISRKKPFRLQDLTIVAISMFGTFLLLTNGSRQSFEVAPPAVIWGLLSATAAAFYIMYAGNLFKHAPSLVIVGWAMLIGGFFMFILDFSWSFNFTALGGRGLLLLSISVIVGTMLAFWLYLESVNYIQAEIVALLGCLEPLTAVILSVIWLNASFGIMQFIGILIIFSIVIYSSLNKANSKKLS